MGRLRPNNAEIVADPMTHVEAMIQYDRQRTDWCTDGLPVILRAERGSDLIRKTATALSFGLGLKWQRSIVMFLSRPDVGFGWHLREGWTVVPGGLAFDRLEVSQRKDGLWLCRDWPPNTDEEIPPEKDKRTVLPLVASLGNVKIWPWTDARWRDLTQIAKHLLRFEEVIQKEDLAEAKALFRIEVEKPPPKPKLAEV